MKRNHKIGVALVAVFLISIISYMILSTYVYNSNTLSIMDEKKFTITIQEPRHQTYEKYYQYYLDKKNDLVELEYDLNSIFNLTDNIEIIFTECIDQDEPHYKNKMVLMCYQFDHKLENIIFNENLLEKSYTYNHDSIIAFVLFHEIAHGLIDVFSLYQTGDEESSADSFATLLMIKQEKIIPLFFTELWLNKQFEIDVKEKDLNLSGPHRLDIKRAYDIKCLIYATDTIHYSYFLDDKLFEERKDNCAHEYIHVKNGWRNSLQEHMKYDWFSTDLPTPVTKTVTASYPETTITKNDTTTITTKFKTSSITATCTGNAQCMAGFITKIIDGDTVDVNDKRIRFSLVSSPEISTPEGLEAKNFVERMCPIGSAVLVDEDDGQTAGSYGRIVGVIYCENINLNHAMLEYGHAELSNQFCGKSEFSRKAWAQKFGC